MKIIGDKNSFGIEYKILNKKKLKGFAKIWLGGNSIGTKEDEIYLRSYLFDGLMRIGKSKKIDIIIEKNPEVIYKFLVKRLNDISDMNIHEYLVNLGTFCDDFTIFSYSINDDIIVLWKLEESNPIFQDLMNKKDNVNYFKINKNEYNKLLSEFMIIIDEPPDGPLASARL